MSAVVTNHLFQLIGKQVEDRGQVVWYDPVELFFDPQTKSIPLRAELIHGSHGVTVPGEDQCLLLSTKNIGKPIIRDTEISDLVLSHFD